MVSDSINSEVPLQSPERPELRTAKDFYQRRILHLETFPKTPAELPSTVYLSVPVIGDLEVAMFKTLQTGKETCQWIYWNANSGFKKTPLYTGTNSSTFSLGVLKQFPKVFWGKRPVLRFHVEPEGYGIPSTQDIAKARAYPRDGYVSLVGSDTGVVGLLQTQSSSKLPLSSIWEFEQTKKYLNRKGFEDLEDLDDLAGILEKLGYGLYSWAPESGKLRPRDIKYGLSLKRISSSTVTT